MCAQGNVAHAIRDLKQVEARMWYGRRSKQERRVPESHWIRLERVFHVDPWYHPTNMGIANIVWHWHIFHVELSSLACYSARHCTSKQHRRFVVLLCNLDIRRRLIIANARWKYEYLKSIRMWSECVRDLTRTDLCDEIVAIYTCILIF